MYNKYIKYKKKYLNIKAQKGGNCEKNEKKCKNINEPYYDDVKDQCCNDINCIVCREKIS